jgi:hypothetical protein
MMSGFNFIPKSISENNIKYKVEQMATTKDKLFTYDNLEDKYDAHEEK